MTSTIVRNACSRGAPPQMTRTMGRVGGWVVEGSVADGSGGETGRRRTGLCFFSPASASLLSRGFAPL